MSSASPTCPPIELRVRTRKPTLSSSFSLFPLTRFSWNSVEDDRRTSRTAGERRQAPSKLSSDPRSSPPQSSDAVSLEQEKEARPPSAFTDALPLSIDPANPAPRPLSLPPLFFPLRFALSSRPPLPSPPASLAPGGLRSFGASLLPLLLPPRYPLEEEGKQVRRVPESPSAANAVPIQLASASLALSSRCKLTADSLLLLLPLPPPPSLLSFLLYARTQEATMPFSLFRRSSSSSSSMASASSSPPTSPTLSFASSSTSTYDLLEPVSPNGELPHLFVVEKSLKPASRAFPSPSPSSSSSSLSHDEEKHHHHSHRLHCDRNDSPSSSSTIFVRFLFFPPASTFQFTSSHFPQSFPRDHTASLCPRHGIVHSPDLALPARDSRTASSKDSRESKCSEGSGRSIKVRF